MKLLYIDDDEDDLRILFDAIRKIDISCEYIMAKGGKEGLKILESLIPDYIFLDINMPQLDGRQVLKSIRADKKLKNVNVIMFSTSISEKEIQAFKNEGATQCLVKPSSFEILLASLRKVFGAAGTGK